MSSSSSADREEGTSDFKPLSELYQRKYRRIPPEVFLWKGALKICSKFTGKHPCRSAISIKLWITLQLGLGLGLFYFILNLNLTCDVTWSRLYLDGKSMRRKCQMNSLDQKKLFVWGLQNGCSEKVESVFFFLFFLIGIHSIQGWTATTGHGVTRKRNTKRLRHTGNLFRNNLQLKDVC